MRPTPLQGAGAGGSHPLDKQSLSLVPAVQELWNAWEIHFMILLSLSLQVFLFLFAGMRRRSSNWFLRTVLWLAYLSADSVAVFVLGHLAVRASEPGHELVSFWAPFVLVHLGGQETITAFSKQDNELWMRHLLNLVFQVAVAGYVVAKASWPDARLRTATVIMFICGCIKYAERVYGLFFANTKWLRDYIEDPAVVGRSRKTTMEEAKKDMSDTLDRMSKGCSSGPPSVLYWAARTTIKDDIISVDAPLNKAQSITVAAHGDLLPDMLNGFLSSKSRHSAYEYVGELLEYCYRRLYTKDHLRLAVFTTPRRQNIRNPIANACLRTLFMTSFLHFILLSTVAASVSLTLFMSVHKTDRQLHTSNRVDITVTYVLLVGAIVLDVCSAASFIFLHLSFYLPCLAKPIQSLVTCCTEQQWSQELGQYNIIICRNAAFTKWFGLGCDVLKSKPVTKDHTSIKKFILDTLLASGTRKEWNIASTRGKLALQKWMDCHKQDDNQQQTVAHHDLATATTLKSLEEIIRSSADFPTSVLVLHIATDICYHFGGTNSDHQAVKHKQTSTELSNYIMYLVFKCGVMLTTNSQIVHNIARDEILKVISRDSRVCSFLQSKLWYNLLSGPGNHKDDTLKLFVEIKKQQQESMAEIQVVHQESEEQQDAPTETKTEESADNDDNAAHYIKELQKNSQTLKSPVLPRAVAVAQELLSINDEAERWKLIAAVWAEMLYYTAPRCGGGFHYEHLSTGGEFVTHVLLLMYHLGPFMPPPS